MSQRHSKDPQVERSLRHSVKDGVAYSVMSGSGESYFAAFSLYFKATTPQIGLLASLPPLLGSLAQLVSAWAGRHTARRKPVILVGATLQGVMLLPLVILPSLFPDQAVTIILGCAVFYFAGANLAAPQWSSLMGDLVPERRRGRYFAYRTRLCSMTAFLALLGAGITLHVFDVAGLTLVGYLVILLVAALARFVSVYHLNAMHDPPGHVASLEWPFGVGFWTRVKGSAAIRFTLYFAAMQFAVAIASPFFIVYMLRDLQFSYVAYSVNIAVSVLVQFLTLNRWGRISDIFGNRISLLATGAVIPVLPLLWLVSTNYAYLLVLQALSGLAWAGFSLSAGNYLYDLVPSNKRVTYIALHNVTAAMAVFLGALLGGYLGTHLPSSLDVLDQHFEWLSPLYGVFVVSTLARASVAGLFLRKLREVRQVRSTTMGGLIFRVARLHPLSWMTFDVVGARRRLAPRRGPPPAGRDN
ncbi:MAG: hypothetical protein AMJ69_10130 [Gammaproteobacteria bacterium SG8_47]|nr:MAG: hypothetical protein AMJ69_10130 [Gammaproteobacteria bacterium SG8_47]